jgi:phosphatidylserine decarboxylase
MSSGQRESRRFLIPLVVALIAVMVTGHLWPSSAPVADSLLVLVLLAFFFVLFFFRDPNRTVPSDPAIVVAPADGLVVSVEEMDEPDFALGRRQRIAIFLSVFDVHVNRSPVAGRVARTIHRPGSFLDVRHANASTHNEALAWLLETQHGPVAVRQIAGLVARRIVAWSREGSMLERGQRFGMIRFGSRTEIFLPSSCQVLVKPGDRVQGAATPIARWS